MIAKASSFEFRNPDIPISVIAQQLGVRYVLGGSVRALGGQIRLAAQLSETASGRVLWSGQFDTERSSAIDLQDQIARGIIVELQPALTRAEIAVIRRQRPENLSVASAVPLHRYAQAGAARGHALSRLRPRARRALSTLRPPVVAIRVRKP